MSLENEKLETSENKKTVKDIREERRSKLASQKESDKVSLDQAISEKENETTTQASLNDDASKKQASKPKQTKAKKAPKREVPKLSDDYQELLSSSLQKLRDQIKEKKNEEKLNKQTKRESNLENLEALEKSSKTINELENKVLDLEAKILELNSLNSNLENEKVSLDNKVDSLEVRLVELENSKTVLSNNVSQLENDKKLLDDKYNTTISDLEAKVKTLEESLNQKGDLVKSLSESNNDLTSQNTTLNDINKNLKEEIESLKLEVSKHDDETTEKDVLLNEYKNKEEKLKIDLEVEKGKINDSENLIKTLQLENENLEKTNDELTKAYDSCKDDLSAKVTLLEEANSQIETLTQERDEAVDKFNEVNDKISELDKASDENESLSLEVERLTNEVNSLTEKNAVIDEELADKTKSLDDLSSDYSRLDSMYIELKEKYDESCQLNEKYKSDKELITRESYDSLVKENEDLKATISELNDELDLMTEHVNDLSNSLNQTEESLDSAHLDISELKEKVQSFDQERIEFNQAKSDLNDEINDKNLEISNLYLQISDIDYKLQETLDKLELAISKEAYDDLLLKNDELQKSNDSLSLEVENLNKHVEELTLNSGTPVVQESVFDFERYNEIESKYESQLSKNRDLQNELDALKLENDSLKKKYDSDNGDLDKLRRLNNDLDNSLGNMKLKYDEVLEKCRYLEIELKNASLKDTSSEDVKFLKNQISENHQEYRRLLNESNEKIKKYQIENEQLRSTIEANSIKYNNYQNDVEEMRHKLLEKNSEVNDLKFQINSYNQELARVNMTLRMKEDEVNSLKNKLDDIQDRYNRDLYQMKSMNQYDENYRRLESKMEFMLDSISKMNNKDNSYPYLEQINEIRNLREEMNDRFNQARQEKYHDELRSLREQFNTLNNRLSQNDSYESLKNQAISEAQIESSEVRNTSLEYTHKPEEFKEEVYDESFISSLGYTKEEITDPRFVSEYSKLERLIQGYMVDIQDDYKRYQNALKQNEDAKRRRNQLIEQVNNRINFLANQYKKSSDNIDAKETYAKEKVIGAEKIRFHEEKIAELNRTNLESETKHKEYRQMKVNQIEELRKKQNELIETYGKILYQKGVMPKVKIPEVSPKEEPAKKKEYNPELKAEFDSKYDAYKKYKAEIDKVNMFIDNLVNNEEVVRQYVQFEKNSYALNERLNELTENNTHLNGLIDSIKNDLSKQEELESLRSDLENNNVRIDDILSKISFNSSKQNELKEYPQIVHYINAKNGIGKIVSRIEILKNDLASLSQKMDL